MAIRNGPPNEADEADVELGESIARTLWLMAELELVLLHQQQAAGHIEQASRELDGKAVTA